MYEDNTKAGNRIGCGIILLLLFALALLIGSAAGKADVVLLTYLM